MRKFYTHGYISDKSIKALVMETGMCTHNILIKNNIFKCFNIWKAKRKLIKDHSECCKMKQYANINKEL